MACTCTATCTAGGDAFLGLYSSRLEYSTSAHSRPRTLPRSMHGSMLAIIVCSLTSTSFSRTRAPSASWSASPTGTATPRQMQIEIQRQSVHGPVGSSTRQHSGNTVVGTARYTVHAPSRESVRLSDAVWRDPSLCALCGFRHVTLYHTHICVRLVHLTYGFSLPSERAHTQSLIARSTNKERARRGAAAGRTLVGTHHPMCGEGCAHARAIAKTASALARPLPPLASPPRAAGSATHPPVPPPSRSVGRPLGASCSRPPSQSYS